jgi:hypothetical protein
MGLEFPICIGFSSSQNGCENLWRSKSVTPGDSVGVMGCDASGFILCRIGGSGPSSSEAERLGGTPEGTLL